MISRTRIRRTSGVYGVVCAPWVFVVMLAVASVSAEDVAVPEFKTDVMPVLTKAGCNSAACHGAAIGRGGLRFSLLGYDPDHDYQQLVNQYKGRRVNLAEPEKSLMLLKPSRQIPHQGGRRLPIDKTGFDIVRRWIAGGAGNSASRELVGLEIVPKTKTLGKVGESLQVKVIAEYDTGETRDVTQWTLFEPNDKQALSCTKMGEVKALGRGQSSLMVRYLGFVGSVTITVPLSDQPLPDVARPRVNFIDDYVNQVLDRLRLEHSPRSDDATFVRRVYLDLIGTLPTPDESMLFQNDRSDNKRAHLINGLMKRDEFVDHWSYKWGDILRIESRRLGARGAEAFHQWLQQQIATNSPLDEFARQLIMSYGDATKNGAANFHRVPNDALQQAELVSQVFMGVRLQCANCHNHPLDRWTQDDFHGLAAVFARVDRGQTVSISKRGDVIHPKTGKPAIARIPGKQFVDPEFDPREELARWIRDKNNPYFARNFVNRIWRDLMGRGLVEPIDDHRSTNPPTHPELLDALASNFVKNGFDVCHLITTIVSSEAYQRSQLSQGNNAADNQYYSRAIGRPMSPPVMVDAVSFVTGVNEDLGGASNAKAISLGDSRVRSQVLDLLGRCQRDSVCAPTENNSGASLPLTLHIINGRWLNAKLDDSDGRLQQFLDDKLDDHDIVSRFYWLAYCRAPSDKEIESWTSKLAVEDNDQRKIVFRDFVWAILNSSEFRLNH